MTSQHPSCTHSSAAITVADNMQQHSCVTCQVLPSTNISGDTLQADLTMRKGPNVELALVSGLGHDECAFAKPQPACAPAFLACSKACACSQTCQEVYMLHKAKCSRIMLQQDCLQLFDHSNMQKDVMGVHDWQREHHCSFLAIHTFQSFFFSCL